MPTIEVIDQKTGKPLSINYETVGSSSNPAIVFIHGWLTNLKTWEDYRDFSEKGYYIIIPDLRGHGNSSLAKDVSIDALASDINALLEQLKVQKAILVGHSMGGMVSQAFYHKYPEKVIALGLWDTGSRFGFGYGIGTLFYQIRILLAVFGMLLVYPITPLFMGILAKSWRIGFKKMGKSELYRKYVGDVRSLKKKAVTRAVLALSSTNLTDKLKNIKVPTMILQGKADKYEVPIQAARILEKNIQNSKLYIVEKASHFAPIEQIDEVKKYFSEFLSSLPK